MTKSLKLFKEIKEPPNEKFDFDKELQKLWQPTEDQNKKIVAEQIYRIKIKYAKAADEVKKGRYFSAQTFIGDRLADNIKMLQAFLSIPANERDELLKNILSSLEEYFHKERNLFHENIFSEVIKTVASYLNKSVFQLLASNENYSDFFLKNILLDELNECVRLVSLEKFSYRFTELDKFKLAITQFIQEGHLTPLDSVLLETKQNTCIESKAEGSNIKITYNKNNEITVSNVNTQKIAKLTANNNEYSVWIETNSKTQKDNETQEEISFIMDKRISKTFENLFKNAQPTLAEHCVMYNIHGELHGTLPGGLQEEFFATLTLLPNGLSGAQSRELQNFLCFKPFDWEHFSMWKKNSDDSIYENIENDLDKIIKGIYI